MFKWFYENSREYNIPIQKVWELSIDPDNWLKWMYPIESFHYEKEIEVGSIIKAKIKNKKKDIYVPILFTKLQPYKEYEVVIKAFLYTLKSLCTYKEISPGKTRITVKTVITSLLIPILKWHLLKDTKRQEVKCVYFFEEMERLEEEKAKLNKH